jgi:hypothetical protein
LKKHSFLKAVADYCFDKLPTLVVAVVVSLGGAIYQHHDGKRQIWREAGPHLLDSHNEIYANVDAITVLSNRLVALERSK